METDLVDQTLSAIRRIIRAVDLHSRQLVRKYGMTGPQAVLLKEIVSVQSISVGQLAKHLSLSQGTVSDIVARLENRGLLIRRRANDDKRRVVVTATPVGKATAAQTGSLLQEQFVDRLNDLQEWERTQLLSSLQRVAAMMEAESLDAAPVLVTGPVNPPIVE